MQPRWRAALLVLTTLAAGAALREARGDDGKGRSPPAPKPSPRLTVERLHDGEAFTAPIADLGTWRPGHDAWTFWRDDKEKGRILVSVDAATGAKTDLVGFTVPKEEESAEPVPMHGIGRGGPPETIWAANGDVLFVAHRGDLHRVELTTGSRLRMTKTAGTMSDPRAAPDGEKISFVRDHDLWAALVAWDRPGPGATPHARGVPVVREVRLTSGGTEAIRHGELDWVYPEELDCTTASWWSPDSTRIAYLSLDETKVRRFPIVDYATQPPTTRETWYPKAGDPNPIPSISVVGLDGAPPVTMDLGADTDVYVPWAAWTPDGRSVLVARLSRSQRKFDLLSCDPTTGASKAILHEEDPAWVDCPPPPRFLAKSSGMLWTSRKDGWWRHHVVDATNTPKAVTPAGRDAGHILAVDEDEGAIFYEAWSDDLLHHVVFRASLTGGEPRLVTDDTFSHRTSFSESGRWFTDSASKARVPPMTTLRHASGTPARVLGETATPAYSALGLPAPEFGRVRSAGGFDLLTVLWKPPDFDPAKRYPVVVEVYGGPGAKVVRDEFAGLWSALLCQEGFLVFSIDNRGSSGRGKAFESGIDRRLGTLELEDQLAGVAWLSAQPFVDPARIGIWGWSYGGYMTCYAMTHAPKAFRAGAAVAPVTDWRLYDSIYTERYMGRPQDDAKAYTGASATAFAKDLAGALLLCHGLSDDNVHAQNTIQLTEALLAARKPFDQLLFPQRSHGIEGASARVRLFARILDHFKRNL